MPGLGSSPASSQPASATRPGPIISDAVVAANARCYTPGPQQRDESGLRGGHVMPTAASSPERTLRNGAAIQLREMTADDADALLQFAQGLSPDDLLFLRTDITTPEGIAYWVSTWRTARLRPSSPSMATALRATRACIEAPPAGHGGWVNCEWPSGRPTAAGRVWDVCWSPRCSSSPVRSGCASWRRT